MTSFERSRAEDRRAGRANPAEPAAEILMYLGPELTDWLANLYGASRLTAEAAVQLMPFGSRASLVACGLAVEGREIDEDGRCGLILTNLWFEVAAAAAAVVDGDDNVLAAYRQRAQRARRAMKAGPASS
jgi:hypothetical protein